MATKKEPEAIEETVVTEPEEKPAPKKAAKKAKEEKPPKKVYSKDGTHGGAWDIMETIDIPRARKGEDRFYYVGINGRTFYVPKGKKAELPRPVVRQIQRMIANQIKAEEYEEEISREGAQM